MTLTLQEAFTNGRKWAEKFAPQPPKKFVPVPLRKPDSEEKHKAKSLRRSLTRKLKTAARNASYFERLAEHLKGKGWRRLKDVAASLGLSIQVFRLIVADAEKEGVIKKFKAREMVWLAHPECNDAVPVVWHKSEKQRVKKRRMKRRFDVGESPEVWRVGK